MDDVKLSWGWLRMDAEQREGGVLSVAFSSVSLGVPSALFLVCDGSYSEMSIEGEMVGVLFLEDARGIV